MIKAPKLYFMDTGLVCYLVGLQSARHVLDGPMAGALFETAVVSNFKKTVDAYGVRDCLYYWRAVAGLEVDPPSQCPGAASVTALAPAPH